MKIKFNIYWFEDTQSWVNAKKSEIESIKTYLKGLGFDPRITFFFDQNPGISHNYLHETSFNFKIINGYDQSDIEQSSINFNDADLVLMDFNLSGQAKGDAIIRYIRDIQNDFFTEVLFYSQGKTQTELRMLADKDGLYCEERELVFDKLKKVIRTLIKKSQDLNNIRGLVMAETSEIDSIMKEILNKVVNAHGLTHVVQGNLCGTCTYGKETRFVDSSGTVIFKFNQVDERLNIVEFINKINAKELYCTVRNFLSLSINTTGIVGSSLDSFDAYMGKICRNILAHVPEEMVSGGDMIIRVSDRGQPNGYREEKFNEVRFVNIRKNILDYKKFFIDLRNKL